MIIPSIKLNNGVSIPQIGLGVFKVAEGDEVHRAVATALEAGYRSIDTAALYGNERGVGEVIAAGAVPRDELFVTTKVWNDDQGYDSTLKAFDASLRRLNLNYVDLYLIHWPGTTKFKETWRALERLYEQKAVRAIGVSNFQPHHLDELLADADIVPAVNQIELHPMLTQRKVRDYCLHKEIAIESWSPLMRGGRILEAPVIVRISEAQGKSPAQIVLRWHIQHGFIVIPKSVTPERIRENIDIFDFKLSDREMRDIDGLDVGERTGPDPDKFLF